MSEIFNWTEILLCVGSISICLGLSWLLKFILKKVRRPNGKKGGFVSLTTVLAFSIISCIALTTEDWFLTLLVVIPAYLIGRESIKNKNNYTWQVCVSATIGLFIPYGIFYLYNTHSNKTITDREEYNDMPDNAIDDRREADTAPELSLLDEERLDEI